MTDIDEIGSSSGCFQSKRRKRKHSESEENENKVKPEKKSKKSLLSVISEKFSFARTKDEHQTPPPKPRSILSPNTSYQSFSQNITGELNYSFEHDDEEYGFSASNYVTNTDYYDPPKKRVKFDEENIVVSSITYQRQQQQMRLEHLKSNNANKSIFSKFIDYTYSLF